jgi:hypothetical protein
MENLSRHTDLLCNLEASLLTRGIQIGGMSKLGWLINWIGYACHMGRFFVPTIRAVTFNFEKAYSVAVFIGMLG